jgi:DNA (cytosine-5)-methyltransferase 1
MELSICTVVGLYKAMRKHPQPSLTTIETCAGAGGQAIGLHQAGLAHAVLIEIDKYASATLRHNADQHLLGRGEVVEGDLKHFAEVRAVEFRGKIDLVVGGVPCPLFSKAGKQLGQRD